MCVWATHQCHGAQYSGCGTGPDDSERDAHERCKGAACVAGRGSVRAGRAVCAAVLLTGALRLTRPERPSCAGSERERCYYCQEYREGAPRINWQEEDDYVQTQDYSHDRIGGAGPPQKSLQNEGAPERGRSDSDKAQGVG